MRTLDRILRIALVVGVWGLLAIVWIKPSNVDAHADGHTHYSHEVYGVAEEDHSHDYAEEGHSHDYAEEGHSHNAYEIYDFNSTVEGVVEDCSVYGGSVSC